MCMTSRRNATDVAVGNEISCGSSTSRTRQQALVQCFLLIILVHPGLSCSVLFHRLSYLNAQGDCAVSKPLPSSPCSSVAILRHAYSMFTILIRPCCHPAVVLPLLAGLTLDDAHGPCRIADHGRAACAKTFSALENVRHTVLWGSRNTGSSGRCPIYHETRTVYEREDPVLCTRCWWM